QDRVRTTNPARYTVRPMGASPAATPPVLVTGAGGFIGSHVVEAFLREGRRVRALVRYSSGSSLGPPPGAGLDPPTSNATTPVPAVGANAFAVGPLEVVFGDVTDAAQMRAVVRGCGSVCHLAALIGIPYSYAAPGSYVDVNVRGTMHLLDAARAEGVRRFVQ